MSAAVSWGLCGSMASCARSNAWAAAESPLRRHASDFSSASWVDEMAGDCSSRSSSSSVRDQSRSAAGRFSCCATRSCSSGLQAWGVAASCSAGMAVANASYSANASSDRPMVAMPPRSRSGPPAIDGLH